MAGSDEGAWLKPVADGLFPESQWAEHGREYWRSLGLILAWPLFFWNVLHQRAAVVVAGD